MWCCATCAGGDADRSLDSSRCESGAEIDSGLYQLRRKRQALLDGGPAMDRCAVDKDKEG